LLIHESNNAQAHVYINSFVDFKYRGLEKNFYIFSCIEFTGDSFHYLNAVTNGDERNAFEVLNKILMHVNM